jgi:hypothetical protein
VVKRRINDEIKKQVHWTVGRYCSCSHYFVIWQTGAYWKGRDGTNVFSFQYLNLNAQASGAQQFDPAHFIYPNADTGANVMIANYARHFTLFNRASSFAVNLIGGSVDQVFYPRG